MEPQKHTIIIADDHEILMDGLIKILSSDPMLHVVDTARNGVELIKKVETWTPELCLVDLDMPELNGLLASEILIQKSETLKIIMLTMHNEGSIVKKAKSIGIKGFVLKTADSDELLFAIKQVLKGKTYFADKGSEPVDTSQPGPLAELEKVFQLTDRELEIVKLLCEGFTNNKIADKLFISPKTVDNHRTNLFKKLDVHNVVELMRFAIKNNII